MEPILPGNGTGFSSVYKVLDRIVLGLIVLV